MTVLGTVDTPTGPCAVRRARREDVPALVALLASDDVAAARESPDDLESYVRAFEAVDADPAQLLVCLERSDGTLIGTLQLTVIPGLSRRGTTRAQVEAVRVADRARGGGVGTGLVRWAIEHARGRGCELVQLTTDATRHDAHRFYARLGFEHTHHGLKLALG
jgi:GNAT superfamily N-acetyltransferase